MKSKEKLLNEGVELMTQFCSLNNLPRPKVKVLSKDDKKYFLGDMDVLIGWVTREGVYMRRVQSLSCAYYRKGVISIMPGKCSVGGNGVRSWSWPGYTVDRTPYGVIQHELGHHVSGLKKGLVVNWYEKCKRESPITSYDGHGRAGPGGAIEEIFSEMFRLFVTNPDFLREIRGKTYRYLTEHFKPAKTTQWKEVLNGAPKGIIRAAANKIRKEGK